ncbi:carbohydrate ABC transporter permease [Streptomyces sp. NPDC058442]|uniref:carbohydrate ABC transporter permease n=1 Tax=Streptomyces sp. NPDC058442 TaxID=3346503 RepID=UPI0036613FC0
MGTAVTRAPATEAPARDSDPRHGPVKSPRPAALKRRGRQENLAGYLFMSPWIAGFLLLTAGPMIASLYFAFTDYNLFDAPRWVGLDNFSEMFADPRWRHSVQVTLWYVAVGTPIKLIAALGVALLLAQKRRGQAFYRAAFYAPSLIGASVSVAIVWKAIFSDDAIVDRTQKLFGVDVGGWTGDPDLIIYSLVALTVWQFGAPMVIFLAGLKQVPRELYQAADVDGAGRLRQFWNITLPMISPVFLFNVLLETIHLSCRAGCPVPSGPGCMPVPVKRGRGRPHRLQGDAASRWKRRVRPQAGAACEAAGDEGRSLVRVSLAK